jgi:methionyl-tRNA synthetase
VQPLDLAEIYGADAFRYFLARDAALDWDAEFSRERLETRCQGDLANDLGNLLHRVVNMVGRYCEGRVPEPGPLGEQETALRAYCLDAVRATQAHVDELALGRAVARAIDAVGEVNRYLEQTAPWRAVKTDPARAATILYHAAEALRLLSVLLHPVLPERTAELWRRLGWQPPERLGKGLAWGGLRPGTEVVAGPPLFPREVDV